AIHWNPDLALSAQLAVDREGLTVLTSDTDLLERLVKISGPAGLCAELIPGPDRHQVLATARRLGIPAVVTGGVAMAHAEDWARQRLVGAIHRNAALDEIRDTRYERNDDLVSRTSYLASRVSWLRPGAPLRRHVPA